MSPIELREAIALKRAHAVLFDHTVVADSTGLEPDEVESDDMDGDEIVEDEADELELAQRQEPMGFLMQGGSLDLRAQADPFVNLSSVYAITVILGTDDRPAHARFDPPNWFGRVRGSDARAAVCRIDRVIRAIADLLSEDFAAFLRDPTPSALGECEWHYFEKGHATLQETVLIRKGLVERLNKRLDRASRLDEPTLGGLLPSVWVFWPPGVGMHEDPMAMPLAAIYSPEYRNPATAQLCASGFTEWTLTDPKPPATWDSARLMKRPFRQLDQRQRLLLLARLIGGTPTAMLTDIQLLVGGMRQPHPSSRGMP